MTDNPARSLAIEVVLTGAVTVDSLRPIQQWLLQLLGGAGSYLFRGGDVTRIDVAAAELLHRFMAEIAARGAVVRWATASRSLMSTARALAIDKPIGLSGAVPA